MQGSPESGVDVRFDQTIEDLGHDYLEKNCYQIRSKAVESTQKESFKTSTMSTRTNLKQQLQREMMLNEEQRFLQTQQKPVLATSAPVSSGFTLGPTPTRQSNEVPIIRVSANSATGAAMVLPQVSFTTTKLENPTQYHLQQEKEKSFQRQMIGQSVPLQQPVKQQQPARTRVSSSVPSPDSPFSAGDQSTATSYSEYDDNAILDVIMGLEEDHPVGSPSVGSPPPMSSTVPTTNFLANSVLSPVLPSCPSPKGEVSSSCPPTLIIKREPVDLTPAELKALQKDRQKKDSHNQIERRRRYNINDRIADLGRLLPKQNDPDFRQNKGNILLASVKHIRELQRENRKLKDIEQRNQQLENANKKMFLMLQQLSVQATETGLNFPNVNMEVLATPPAEPIIKQETLEPQCTNMDDVFLQESTQMAAQSLGAMSPTLLSPDNQTMSPLGNDMDVTMSDFDFQL